MRIAMLSWESLHSIAVGGVAAHVSELAAALAKMGHEVEVFTRMGPGQSERQTIEGVLYHRCPYEGKGDFIDDVNSMCRAFVHSVFASEDEAGAPFDVIHAHDWLAANALIWIKKGRERLGVQTIHSTEYGRSGNVFHDGASARVRDQERAGIEWADRVIAVSGVTRDEVEWMYEVPGGKTAVVHNGVNPERFADAPADLGPIKKRYQIGPTDPTVLFCGRLVWQKGPDLLVEAVPALLQEHPRAKIVFAGDGQMRGQLERRARKMGVHDAIRFLGHRSGPELVELFQMCQMVCVPSRNEPFGIVVLEGWSAGKPVVATHVGGPSEYLRHEVDGLKVYPNPESVAWGLRETFRDFERAEAMGAEGRRSVERGFRWERIAEQTLDVYDPDRALRGPEEPATVAPAAEPLPVEAGTPEPADAIPEPVEAETPVVSAAEKEAEESLLIVASSPKPGANGSSSNGSGTNGTHRGAERGAERSDNGHAEEERIAVAAELSLERSNGETEPMGEALAACERALAGRGWRVQRRGTQMRIEGDLEQVLGALQRCHQQIHRLGTLRLKTSIHTLQIQPPTAAPHGNGHVNGYGHGHNGSNGDASPTANGSARKARTASTVA